MSSVDLEKAAVERGIAEMGQTKDRMDAIFTRIQEVDKLVSKSSTASKRQSEHMSATTSMLKEVVDTVNETLGSVDETLELTHKQRRQIAKLDRISTNLHKSSGELSKAIQKVGVKHEVFDVEINAAATMEKLLTIASDEGIVTLQEAIHKTKLTSLLQSTPEIEAIWSNREDGSFIFSLPEAGLLNARGREWWKQAMKGKSFTSDVYISAITKQPCLTISVPITSRNGELLGVIGADIRVK